MRTKMSFFTTAPGTPGRKKQPLLLDILRPRHEGRARRRNRWWLDPWGSRVKSEAHFSWRWYIWNCLKSFRFVEYPNLLTSFCQNIRVDSEKLSPPKNWSCYLEVAKHGGKRGRIPQLLLKNGRPSCLGIETPCSEDHSMIVSRE